MKPDAISRLPTRRANASVSVQALTANNLQNVHDSLTAHGSATRSGATGARGGRAAKAPAHHPASTGSSSLWSLAQLPQRVFLSALGAFLLAGPALAADRVLWTSLSHVILAPADGPHVATVEFLNGSVHMTGIETHTLDIPGLSITVTADVGQGTRPDTITVSVPEGFYAWPESLTVAEGGTDTLLIYRDSAELF